MKELLIVICLCGFVCPTAAWPEEQNTFFPTFADGNTLALWLFDETPYPHATLTDAGLYGFDLRLMQSACLAPGKYGNALVLQPGQNYNVCFAERGNGKLLDQMRRRDQKPSGLWGPTTTPQKLVSTLASGDWTCEFWLKPGSPSVGRGTVLQLGFGYVPGFSVELKDSAAGFVVSNEYAGLLAVCPTASGLVADGEWHHAAFVCTAVERKVDCFLDGVKQPAPAVSNMPIMPKPEAVLDETNTALFDMSGDYERFRGARFNLALGEDLRGNAELPLSLDEIRFSSVIRYRENFPPPASFARNCAPAVAPSKGHGQLPLLFADTPVKSPVNLGSRKYVFIDESIVDSKDNVRLAVNPPVDFQPINCRFHNDFNVLDHEGKVLVLDPEGYSSDEGLVRLWSSDDGLTFQAPELGLVDYHGSRKNNIVLKGAPFWGCLFEDANPVRTPDGRFKLMAWLESRGAYLYLSPDMVHWRRNETCALPLVSGGNAETFWDDQRGKYVMFLKRDSSYNTAEYPGTGRRACLFEAVDAAKPWPFHALENQSYEACPFPSVSGEGPVAIPVTKYGDVVRTRAVKYPWAPDTYLAFVWRFGRPGKIRQTELNVSRDGIHWNGLGDLGMYVPNGGTFDGINVLETLAQYGLVRRGDVIWQYYTLGSGPNGAGDRRNVRTAQRLDGFVSMDAGLEPGTITTKPMVFSGNRLELNVKAKGWMKAGILDENEKPVDGFAVEDGDAFEGDSVRKVVSWRNGADVRSLAGRPIRLKFELKDAKLFAFQFTEQ